MTFSRVAGPSAIQPREVDARPGRSPGRASRRLRLGQMARLHELAAPGRIVASDGSSGRYAVVTIMASAFG